MYLLKLFSQALVLRIYIALWPRLKVLKQKILDAAQISELATTGQCEVCDATLNQFCDWIGSVAGDLALTFGALGGVFIGGGILPRMQQRYYLVDLLSVLQTKALCRNIRRKSLLRL